MKVAGVIGRRFLKVISVVGIGCFFSTSAFAEFFGMPNGRSANIASQADRSVEVGFVTGDFGENSYQHFGGRFNFKFSPEAILYVDAGNSEIEDFDGMVLGVGMFYQIEGLVSGFDTAIRAGYHTGDVKRTGFFDVDVSQINLEAIISGTNVGQSDFGWYANLGVHKAELGDDDETEIGFGGGVVLPLTIGEFYFGADLIDELIFGGGIRYNF